jgi:hypothetical protein
LRVSAGVFAAIALAVWAAAGPAATQPGEAFDLLCSSTTGPPVHFRFELRQQRWCVGPCNAVWHIDELGDAVIGISVHSSDHQHDWTVQINRYTATYTAVHIGWGNAPADAGRCVAKPFSGFPGKQF